MSEVIEYYPSCGDNSCIFGNHNMVGTNGGCRCFKELEYPNTDKPREELIADIRIELRKLRFKINCLRRDRDRLQKAIDDISTRSNSQN